MLLPIDHLDRSGTIDFQCRDSFSDLMQTGGVRSMTVYFAEGDRDGFAAVPGTAGQGAEGGYYVVSPS